MVGNIRHVLQLLEFRIMLVWAGGFLDKIQEFRPYRKENTTLHRYKAQPVNAV
jgi:hypothetical protein